MSSDLKYSSIHYDKFHKILALTNNHQRAAVLDKVIFWSLNSTYKLPRSNDTKPWFTQTYEQMSDKTKVPVSTLKKYMAYFEQQGWVERVRKKLGENVRAFFRITKKLLSLLGLTFAQNGTPKRSEKGSSILKDNKLKTINPITLSAKEEKTNSSSLQKTVHDLYQKYRSHFSISEKQLYAEIEFTLENPEFLKETKSFAHKINIISKLIREKNWKTPKGFFKYSKTGMALKEKLGYLNKKERDDKSEPKNKPVNRQLMDLKNQLFLTTSQKRAMITLSSHNPSLKEKINEYEQEEMRIMHHIEQINAKMGLFLQENRN